MFSFSNNVNKGNRKRNTGGGRRAKKVRGRRCHVESLETRNLFAGVVSLTLVDAATDRDVMTLSNGATIDFAALGTTQLNVRANVDSGVESVRFALDGIANFRTENSEVYSLAGDKGGNYHAWTPTLGIHTLTATPFSADNAGGAAGTAMSVSFNVINGTPPPATTSPAVPTDLAAAATSSTSVNLQWTDASSNESGFHIERSMDGKIFTRIATLNAGATSHIDGGRTASTTYYYRVLSYNVAGSSPSATTTATTPATPVVPDDQLQVTGLTLVNADTDKDLMPLVDGMILDLSALPTRNLSVRVDATGDVLSVRFNLDGNASYRIESSRPFSLSGDNSGNFNPWTPTLGSHTLTVTPYSGKSASGTAGGAVTVRFTVTDNVTIPAAPSGLTATATDSSHINLAWTDNSSDEAGFRIERSTDGSSWSHVASVGAGVKSYTAYGLNASTRYYFRVSAYNAAGASAASNVADATTSAATNDDTNVGVRPGPDNTGPTNPSVLKVFNGLYKITTDGAVVENIEVYGGIYIDADNVTLRNFRVVANSYYGINVAGGHAGIVIEDGEITGAKSAGLKGGGYTARRLELHHFGADAIKPGSSVLVEDSWIHHLGMSDGAHADGVQVKGSAHNLVFRGNFFDMPHGLEGFRHNSAFIMDPNGGSITGLVIDGNWINGGGWTIHITESVSSAVVRNNLFGRDYNFGVKRVSSTTIWENNRWWDTLELVGQ